MPNPRAGHALLLHGAGGGGWEWAVWSRVFEAAGLVVSAPDLLPVGDGLAATGLDDYRSQADAALRALPRPRLLVGASLGGLLAAAIAPDSADALVLVNPLPPAPWAAALPARDWAGRVSWGRLARLDSTRRAIPDAEPATALFAFRRWRDESGQVLRQAHAGLALSRPDCPVLCMASIDDDDVPPGLTGALAHAWGADMVTLPGASHVGPLLGREAAACAETVLAWWARSAPGVRSPASPARR
ncbi:alpha/beta hydrolase [Marilutibacter spongiae]|uniref:Alpha/beta hydrolase n=1 Tax=Marilutibacter spongiae TaxID=2025720 RepID=A0A7W3TL42_9GAMM|nr:alpha/beta hydrolase [Lysobacter spongiae]MBB1060296.1 alpha/beta hydrolase [Lysobacter spongiae]